MRSLLSTAGRVLYALPIGIFGIFHLMQSGQIGAAVPPYFPGPGALWAVITGIVFLLASASLFTRKHVKPAMLLMSFQLVVFALVIWIPGMRNPEMGQIAVVNLLKDTALLGAALILAGMAGHHEGSSHDHSHEHSPKA